MKNYLERPLVAQSSPSVSRPSALCQERTFFNWGQSQIRGFGAVGKISEKGALAFYILDIYR
ncbi:hypothetical protein Q0L23_22300 [Klebsiella michiganensis]|uniref:hypothetical protein n=1 Tax=Klebsiella michiganensis TaxID=1134687 RepID=UPI00265A2A67|nr:hypothetical protein [Klebsiella michiganensis]WKJ96029.1 hypothetical protein Q0L46_18000 [Klebsiella michiganensis]WKK02626.1 hypothetical protein Q0L23_22300 [Klebsiella michiganensis]